MVDGGDHGPWEVRVLGGLPHGKPNNLGRRLRDRWSQGFAGRAGLGAPERGTGGYLGSKQERDGGIHGNILQLGHRGWHMSAVL